MKKLEFLILYILAATVAFASDYSEKWNTHFSYYTTNRVCITENKVFALANNHLYSVSKEDGVLETYTKLDGFSENEISEIEYNKDIKSLIIVYNNSNIDILDSDGTIYNIPDLYQKQMSVNKTVYQITMEKEYAYLSTGFGIVVVNLKKKEIANTYIIGPNATKIPIYGITIDDDYIYALSDGYIYKAPKEETNLLDYNFWQEDRIPLATSEKCKTLFKFSNSLFTIKSDSIVYQYNGKWQDFYKSPNHTKLSFSDNKMVVSAGYNGIVSFNEDLSEDFKSSEYYTLDAEYDIKQKLYWIASEANGCRSLTTNNTCRSYRIPGPGITDGQRLIYSGDKMYYINGRGSLTSRGFKTPSISYINNHNWNTLNTYQMGCSDFIDYTYDVTSIVTDPKDYSHWYFSTFGEGIFEVKNNKIEKLYNSEATNNQIPPASVGNKHSNYCDGLAIDSYGNIYVASSIVESPISIYSPSTDWKNLNHQINLSSGWSKGFVFTSKFRLLISTRADAYLFFWHDNKTPLDSSDDKTKLYRASEWIDKDGKSVNPDFIYDVKEDKNGTLWVGTELGPILLQNPSKIFDNNDYRCSRVKINRDDDSGLADYLLDGETIYAIEVDYGNRKWIGTANSGLYLISEDGTETIAHFTKDNSPLSSNSISDIELNPMTGELFIATPEGVYSYKTDSTKPVTEATKNTIYAYPNPVRPEYSGDVIIGGLENNSNVWITDASGDLVFKGRTIGGSISWDCKNSSGQYVTGGVYIVLVSNENSDNPNSVATKILVVR